MSRDQHTGDDPTQIDIDSILDELGFDAEENLLTRRQAEVLVMREHGFEQEVIAGWLGCSRANVSSIEGSARRNIDRAHETVSFAELLAAPVRVDLPAGLDLYDVPDRIYKACDDHGIKVGHGAPELIRLVREGAPTHLEQGTIIEAVAVRIAGDGSVRVLTP